MKLGFSGTSAGMTAAQLAAVRSRLRLRSTDSGWILHHGDCVGADAEAHAIALQFRMGVVLHPPDNPAKRAFCEGAAEARPEAPYMARNGHIAAEADELLAAPETSWERTRSGTWSTVRRARKRGIPILIVGPEGDETWENRRG